MIHISKQMSCGVVRKVSRQDIQVVNSSMEKEDNGNHFKECVNGGGGLSQYISWLCGDKRPLHDVIAFRKEINDITIDIALQWYLDVYSDTVLGFANGVHTIDGGTQIDGLKASLTRTINSLAKKKKLVKDLTLSWEHIREGLTCIVSVVVSNPEFTGQTKTRLGNQKIREVVDKSVQEYLTEYFELHPDVFENIYYKSFNAYKKALGVERASNVIRSESVSTPRTIPKNLTNRSSGKFEIVIHIGASGGAAKHGDDRRFQSKRTLEQPRSSGEASTAPPGRSLENTSDSSFDKKRQKVVPSSHPCSSSRQTVAASNRPNRKEVGVKTLKRVSPGSNKTKPVIPVGPGFQAEIPVWIAPTKKGKFYGSPGDTDTLRWLGTGVWPTYTLKETVYYKKVGEGRPDSCSCATPGSTDCVKLHIKEARELLGKEIGDAFYTTWKFDEMGDVGSKSWTAKEEQKFEAVVKKNSLSSCDGFWKYAFKAFPRRSEKDLISYYYNVFLNHRNTDDDHYGDFLADHR